MRLSAPLTLLTTLSMFALGCADDVDSDPVDTETDGTTTDTTTTGDPTTTTETSSTSTTTDATEDTGNESTSSADTDTGTETGTGGTPNPAIELELLASVAAPGAEIAAFDPASDQIFVTNGGDQAISVFDISDPTDPTLSKTSLAAGTAKTEAAPTSVAVGNGIVAIAISGEASEQDNGTVVFYNAADLEAPPVIVPLEDGDVPGVGPLPDMLTFTPDGNTVVVALEGEPGEKVDPGAGVALLDVTGGFAAISKSAPELTLLDFTAFTSIDDVTFPEGADESSFRVFDGNDLALDVEPEFVTISGDGSTAYVTLQEANGLAVVDLETPAVTALFGLGFKDHSQPGNGLDATDSGEINIENWPLLGMYQPDAIAWFEQGGMQYLVSANEGDARDGEEIAIEDMTLNKAAFPNAAELQAEDGIGGLEVTNTLGAGKAKDFVELYSFGARSISIWNATTGALVGDTGAQIEEQVAEALPEFFNADNDDANLDSRSDRKGPEPEGVVVGELSGVNYAFVGLERVGGVMVFDLSDPASPAFVSYINTRTFEGKDGGAGDRAPEGLVFIPASDSPNDNPLLVVSYEESETLAVFQINENED